MDTKKLRQKILDLAIHGKLVPQDPNDEPASVLLERIRAEKERLVKEGKIKKSKSSKTTDTPHYENRQVGEANVPFEVPKGWCWSTIDEVAESNIGLTYKPSDICENGVPVYRSNNIQNRRICLNELVRVSATILPKQYLQEGDLLICARNGSRNLVGKCAIIENLNEPTSFGAFMAVCRSVLNPWIFHVLNSDYFNEYLDDSNSTAINQVTQKMLLAFKIPVPPLIEQERIILQLQHWFTLIDQIEQGKSDLQTVIKQTKSKILDLAIHGKLVPQNPADEPASELLKRINPNAEITCDNGQYGKVPEEWIMCTIGDLFDVVSAKRVLKSDWKNKGIPFYRAREIVQLHKEGIADKDLFITEELFAELKDKFGTPNVGDIMLSAVGSIGYTYIVNEKDSFYYKDASVLCLRNVNKLNSQYFSMLFETTFVKEQMHDNSKGTTVDTITIEKLKKYFVPLPPLAEQHRIVTKIEELFSSLDNIQKALEV